jgi:hypothetical protein
MAKHFLYDHQQATVAVNAAFTAATAPTPVTPAASHHLTAAAVQSSMNHGTQKTRRIA